MKASHTHPFSQPQVWLNTQRICTDGIICPWDISGQSLLTMGKILDDSWFNGTSTKPTVNLNSSPGSPATMKLGSIILLH